jgi:CRP-like cAMP-binding protein
MFGQVNISLLSFASYSREQLVMITDRLKPQLLRADDCLIKEGQICKSFYFVNSGAFRHYAIDDNGEEATLNLYIPGDWMFEYKSFLTQQPSQHILQATADSEVLGLHVQDFHELAKVADIFFRLGRIFEQAIQNQDFQHNRLTPEQKYELLLAAKPEVLQHFPLKHIASYLCMTPETLSRVRKKISS